MLGEGDRNTLTWLSNKQTIVALSSSEAELVALVDIHVHNVMLHCLDAEK